MIKSLKDEEGCEYLGVLQFDCVKSKEMKDMITKEYYWRITKILSLNAWNDRQAVNARVVLIIRYEATIVEWRKNEVEAIDRNKSKSLTMYRILHPRVFVDRLYWKRKDVGNGPSVEECVWIEISRFRFLPERIRTATTKRSSNWSCDIRWWKSSRC